MTDTTTTTPALGDTVALTSRLLFDHDLPREGTVTAVADDGKITAEFPQDASFPLIVTSDAEHFTVVRRAPDPLGYVFVRKSAPGAMDAMFVNRLIYPTREAATAAGVTALSRRPMGEGETFIVCRLVPEVTTKGEAA